MPIQPPQFNVPALSPAALLAERRARREAERADDPFRGLFDQAINFALNRALVEHQQGFYDRREAQRQASAREIDVNRRVSSGELIPVENIETELGLVGTDIPQELPIVKIDDREFLTNAAFQRFRSQQPVEGAFEDVTREELGTLAQAGMQHEAFPGDKQIVLERLQALRRDVTTPGSRAAVDSLIERTREDERFTLREERRAMADADLQTMAAYGQVMRQMQEIDEDERAGIAERQRLLSSTLQVLGPSGERRNLAPHESQILAAAEVAPDRLSPEALNAAEALRTRPLVPRLDATDVREDFQRAWVGSASQTNTRVHTQAMQFIDSYLRDDDGNIVNEKMREDIERVAGGTTMDDISEFLQTPGGIAAQYRAAFALTNTGRFRYSEMDKMRASGLDLPYSAIERGWRKIDPGAFFDRQISSSPVDRGVDSNPITPGEAAGLRHPTEEGERNDALSAFSEDRQIFSDTLRARVQRGGEEEAALIRDEIRTFIADRDVAIASFRASAQEFREQARNARNEEVAEQLRQIAERYEGYARAAEQRWTEYQEFRDSVVIPVAEREGILP